MHAEDEDPYASPIAVPPASPSCVGLRGRLKKARPALLLVFWFGVVHFVLGGVITFYPGAETQWFLITSAVLAAGLLVDGKAIRVAALLLIAISLASAVAGHHRKSEYDNRRSQPSMDEEGTYKLPP